MKNILIVGGDGFCGWPLSLRLSKKNHNVTIIDNLSRRKIDIENNSGSLTPIKSIYDRIETWHEVTGKKIGFYLIDVAKEYERLKEVIKKENIDIIIHLGEQRAAPYSMKNSKTSRYTVDNNICGTHNILSAIVNVNTSIHLIHIGTMGVYGYGAIENRIIPEGYINIKLDDGKENYKDLEILHPFYPGSIYHLTKAQECLFFQFYTKNWNIKITDLHQGIIWGLSTEETILHPNLCNRLDYDSDYGTVLNRFIMQAAYDLPLTVYGTGNQTRAFINIQNSMDCIELAIENPPLTDKVKIINQMTETHTLNDLAKLIKNNFDAKIEYIENPRKELSKNSLTVCNQQFLDLGLKPIYLNTNKLTEIYYYLIENKSNINKKIINPISKW